MTHYLKTCPQFYKEVKAGNKTFELRKNDRDYKVGDILVLQEYNPNNTCSAGLIFGFIASLGQFTDNGYTGNEIEKKVNYILKGSCFGLEENYVIMGLK